MAIKNVYRPCFLTLEDRSLPSGLGLDWLPDLFESKPPENHHISLIEDSLPLKKPQNEAGTPTTAPGSPGSHPQAPPVVATHTAQPAVPVLPRGGHGGPLVVQEVVKASGPAIGNWVVTKAHSETTNTPFGWFTMLNARSNNSLDTPTDDIHTLNGGRTALAYGPGAFFTTRQTMRPGTKYTPAAIAKATITTFTPPVYVWTGAGTAWGIIVNGPTGVIPGETALAAVRIQDPVTFPDLSPLDGGFTVEFDQEGSWSVDFPPQDPDNGIVYDASVTLTGSATSSVPGYENLFSYSITLSPGSVAVSVTSNPNLHWGDIATEIADSYSWDGEFMSYNGPPLVAAGIPIPTTCAIGLQIDGGGPLHVGHGGLGCSPSASFGLAQDAEATVTAPSTP